MPDFLVTVRHARTGKAYPPFVVSAPDEAAARRLCRRKWLVLSAVVPYEPVEGQPPPERLPFGPPISGRSFERDYHYRPPDPDTASGLSAAARVGLFGLVGIALEAFFSVLDGIGARGSEPRWSRWSRRRRPRSPEEAAPPTKDAP